MLGLFWRLGTSSDCGLRTRWMCGPPQRRALNLTIKSAHNDGDITLPTGVGSPSKTYYHTELLPRSRRTVKERSPSETSLTM